MQRHFGLSEIDERRQAITFSERFEVELEKIPQGPGVCGDYRVTKTSEKTKELESSLGYPIIGHLIEFKNDKASKKTGNLFVEFEQTSDGWFSRKPSGHALAISNGCVLVISAGEKTYVFNTENFQNLVKGATRDLCTRPGRNGNRPGCYTRAKLVPLKTATGTACYRYNTIEQIAPRTELWLLGRSGVESKNMNFSKYKK